MSHALRGALISIVPGAVSVGPTIFSSFVAPYIFREVSAAEYDGAVGAPCWLVSSPVFAGITTAFAALVFFSGVILVLLWGLLLPLLPQLCCAHCQLLLNLAHRHRLLLKLGLLVADILLGARVTARKFLDERLVLRVARWLVLNLVSGVASVVLAAAHLSRGCANFPFAACFHSPPYPCVCQCAVASRECVPLLILCLEHSCFSKTYISILSASLALIWASAKMAYAIP